MKRIFLLATFLLSFLQAKADEGMWLLMLIKRLNGMDMKKQGLRLTPEEIYSVNNSSLKDAIVQFGGGCTGEMVSDKGLLFTNHHCGYGNIAELSTPEKDYLNNGYWAKNYQEEIPAPGLSVRFLVKMGDATQRINAKLNNKLSASERKNIIDAEYKAIQAENSENGKYTVVVRDFFNGNEFYYFIYQDYKDVRLVGTPPNSLGKFGGDTDNWEWPRHTADFAVFRVYADANGNPAEYSVNNKPLTPKHSLPVSIKGVDKGDYTMIMGYPGRTNRYLTSYGISQLVYGDYPAWVEASKKAMDVMKKYMDKDHATSLNYASQYASVANYWKNRQGTIDAVLKNGTINDKKKVEKAFQKWANKSNNKATYANVLSNIEGYYKEVNAKNIERNYAAQLQRNTKYISIAYQLGSLFQTYAKQDADGRAKMNERVSGAINRVYEKFNTELETEMLKELVNLYQSKVNPNVASSTLKNTNISSLSNVVAGSIFANKETATAFFKNPSLAQLENDALKKLADAYIKDAENLANRYQKADEKFGENTRLFLNGLMKSQPKKSFYPDANSTMRLTYGNVVTLPVRADRKYHGISAKDNYYTDQRGILAKYKKGDEEFDLSDRFLDLMNKKEFGQYADKKTGNLHLNFLSDNDITGGNSGSPILDADGNLIGLAFDGNSEALSGDIVFEADKQRTINVDSRFVLWVIDVYGGAKHLIEEMKIVK